MKTLMSINKKFMSLNSFELIELVRNNSKNIDGYEICIDYNNHDEIEYLKQLAYNCKKNNLLLQIHGDSSLELEKQIECFGLLKELSDLLGYRINVVLHPISKNSKKESIEVTTNYLENLTKTIDNNKCIISLENLNDDNKEDRLDHNDIMPIVMNNENVYLTYDMGHVLAEYGDVTSINENMIPLITNIHLHTMNNKYSSGFDHKPILKGDENWNYIMKAITFLKFNKYNGPVVFEYDLYACNGNTLQDKIINYAKSIDYVAERIK